MEGGLEFVGLGVDRRGILALEQLEATRRRLEQLEQQSSAVRAEMEAELEVARRTLRGELVPISRSSTDMVRASDVRARRRA